jgi:hypothetical protein
MWHAILGLERPTAKFHTHLKELDLLPYYPWSRCSLQVARNALNFHTNLWEPPTVSQQLDNLFQTYGPQVGGFSFKLNACYSIAKQIATNFTPKVQLDPALESVVSSILEESPKPIPNTVACAITLVCLLYKVIACILLFMGLGNLCSE